MRLLNVSLWDLDNCLFNDSWRVKFIDWDKTGNQRYDRYDEKMVDDQPAHMAQWNIITAISTPVFITGRREKWREITKEMIKFHLPLRRDMEIMRLHEPVILMRPDDSDERPVELKQRLLQQFLVSRHMTGPIIGAFDDVQSIVSMYRSYDIPAAVLRCHDPANSYSPKDL